MMQDIFGINTIQLDVTSNQGKNKNMWKLIIGNIWKDTNYTDSGYPKTLGWQYGQIKTLHPLVEKWAELLLYWDLQLFKYASTYPSWQNFIIRAAVNVPHSVPFKFYKVELNFRNPVKF